MATLWIKVEAFLAGIWIYIAIAVVLFAAGFFEGDAHVTKQWNAANAKSAEKTLEDTQTLATAMEETREKADAAQALVIRERDSAIASLRSRPDRVPVTAAATCAGSTGLELARPDAEFLIGESADSLKWQQRVIACYNREDELRKAMLAGRK